jgi:hypothetical protein
MSSKTSFNNPPANVSIHDIIRDSAFKDYLDEQTLRAVGPQHNICERKKTNYDDATEGIEPKEVPEDWKPTKEAIHKPTEIKIDENRQDKWRF